mgnify:CR=1 FL=1
MLKLFSNRAEYGCPHNILIFKSEKNWRNAGLGQSYRKLKTYSMYNIIITYFSLEVRYINRIITFINIVDYKYFGYLNLI